MAKIRTQGVTDLVADTLFIPLYMRCRETLREDRIIEDLEACRIVDSVDYDFSKYTGAEITERVQAGVCVRVRHFDEVTRNFILSNADPVVVSLGCGLDTRAARIGLDKGVFYNVDLPEVMEVRDRLLPPDERNISIHKSMFDEEWPRMVREKHPDSPILVMAEGVFIYFTEPEVRAVVEMVAEALAPGSCFLTAAPAWAAGCPADTRNTPRWGTS